MIIIYHTVSFTLYDVRTLSTVSDSWLVCVQLSNFAYSLWTFNIHCPSPREPLDNITSVHRQKTAPTAGRGMQRPRRVEIFAQPPLPPSPVLSQFDSDEINVLNKVFAKQKQFDKQEALGKRCVLPRVGYVLPLVGYVLPRVGYVLPRVGYVLPRVGYVLPRVGYGAMARVRDVMIGSVSSDRPTSK